MATFFVAFGVIETIYPFQPFNAASALIIFGVLAILFKLSLYDGPDEQNAIDG